MSLAGNFEMIIRYWRGWRERRTAERELRSLRHEEVEYPWLADELSEAARMASASGDSETALRHWTGIRTRFPDNKGAYTEAIALLRKLRRLDEAEAIVEVAQRLFPHDPGFAKSYAQIAEARRDFQNALDRWRKVQTDFPDDPAGYTRAANCLRLAGRYDEAASLIEGIAERFPDSSARLAGEAKLVQETGNWAEALRLWQEIHRLFKPNPTVLLGLIKCLHELHCDSEAEAVLDEARQAFPTHSVIPFQYAAAAERRGDWPEALLRWEWLRDRFPGDPRSHAGCGRVLSQLDRHADAECVLQNALARFPNEPSLLIAAARLAHERRDWSEAMRRWELVIHALPNNVEARRRVTQAESALGKMIAG
jgi:tetratricopeptide (TPR) repeat protein